MSFQRLSLFLFCSLLISNLYAQKIVNVYAWTGEMPDAVVRQFERETGIKVNLSTYENNEIMYAKLRAARNAGYDVIMPSSYFVDRMRKQKMLLELDIKKLPNRANIDPSFLNPAYDPGAQYCLPFIWGITGIFYNSKYFSVNAPHKWNELWNARFKDQLMLLDDNREIFSMALMSLGYSANDTDPKHIEAAYIKLKSLMQNVKVFSTDTVISIIIDEDATVGMAWNGDAFKAGQENKNIHFVYPEEGFVIWVDNFAIPKGAPHQEEAYTFINFMLRPDVSKTVALYTQFPITNVQARKLLPADIRDNPNIYPPKSVLARGQFQIDVGESTLALFEKYWEELKMNN